MTKSVQIREIFIVAAMAAAFVVLASWFTRDANFSRSHPLYFLEYFGEKIDVNFVVFGAPEKQVRHLELAQKRLDEILVLAYVRPQEANRWAKKINREYQSELARAEFMAEQLALLDPKFIPLIEQVYLQTFVQLQQLQAFFPETDLSEFKSWAQVFNSHAIKILLHRHQYTAADTKHFADLVRKRLDLVKLDYEKLSPAERTRLALAESVLAEGKEVEWVYDLIASVRY